MKKLDKHDRQQLIEKLKFYEHEIINEIVTSFFLNRPASSEYGETEKMHCENDLRYHLTFLRNAIEIGTQETFGQYFQWSTNLLKARNIPHYDIENFWGHISDVLDSHLSKSEKTILKAFLFQNYSKVQPRQMQTPSSSESSLALDQEVFLQALLAGNRHAAKTVALEALSKKHPLLDIYVEIFQESLYQIGDLWEKNVITVAQEHMATAITQFVLITLYGHINSVQEYQGKGIVTGVEGEFHQVGAHMVADVLEMQGWDIRFLGVNMPQKTILQMIHDFQPDLVGISATMLLNVPTVRDLIAQIRSSTSGDSLPRILVGGAAFRSLPHIYREIEADGFASDLRSLITLL